MGNWCLYILTCCDGSYYTGVTTDVKRRLVEHNSGVGSTYVYTRRPANLLFVLHATDMDRSYAQKLEHKVKRLKVDQKEEFMRGEGALYHHYVQWLGKITLTNYLDNGAAVKTVWKKGAA